MTRSTLIWLAVVVTWVHSPAQAPTQSPARSPQLPDRPATIASSLEGNWQITGDRSRAQYPLLSGMIHAEGRQITILGEKFATCLGSNRRGAGGTLALSGRIAPDGSFTLDEQSARNTVQVTISGTVPAGSAGTWPGTYTFSGSTGPDCTLDQTGSFTATPLPPLTGSLRGALRMSATTAQAPHSPGPASANEQFTITLDQKPPLTHVFPAGNTVTYLPITGVIEVEGSSCFKRGIADLSRYSVVEGKSIRLRFLMDDASELSLSMSLTDSTEEALLIQVAGVRGGSCDGQQFDGTLLRHPPQGGVPGGFGAHP